MSMTGWVLYKDIWPRWQADSPPPFVIDLADEAQPALVHTEWKIFVNGQDQVFHLETWVRFLPKEDSFELNSELWPRIDADGKTAKLAQFGMYNKLVVSREGELRSFNVRVTEPLPPHNDNDLFKIIGNVKGDSLFTRIVFTNTGLEKPFDPVPIKNRSSVLNPLQPLNRLTNLRPGQKWRMPLVDPFGQAFSLLVPLSSGYVRYLDAEVLPEVEPLAWKNRDVPCLVVEYQGDEATGKTWVREADGLVLRQELTVDGKSLILQRD